MQSTYATANTAVTVIRPLIETDVKSLYSPRMLKAILNSTRPPEINFFQAAFSALDSFDVGSDPIAL
jgi:hypothetical protein